MSTPGSRGRAGHVSADDSDVPDTDGLVIVRTHKAPTKARQAGMIGHEQDVWRYRGLERHPNGNVYRINIPTLLSRLEALLAEAKVPANTRDRIIATAEAKYGTDRHVETMIPEDSVVPGVWTLLVALYGAAGDDKARYQAGMVDKNVPTA